MWLLYDLCPPHAHYLPLLSYIVIKKILEFLVLCF